MKNTLFIMCMAMVLILSGYAFAYGCGGSCGGGCGGCKDSCGASVPKSQNESNKVAAEGTEINNKSCPVMGLAISEPATVKAAHEGKIYNLCCSGCLAVFKENPKKYIENIDKILEKNSKIKSCDENQSCQG